MLSTLLYELLKREQRSTKKIKSGKMLKNGLIDVILALFHVVATPRHPILTPVPPSPLSPLSSIVPHRHMLERPYPLPPTDRRTDRWSPQTPMHLHEVVGVGHVSSTVGVAPNWITLDQGPSSSSHQEEETKEKKQTGASS
jgi:hypothetical protein